LYLALKECNNEEILATDGDLVFSEKALRDLLEKKKSAILTKVSNDLSEVGNRVIVEGQKVRYVGKHLIVNPPFFIYSGMMKVIKDDIHSLKPLLTKYFRKDMGRVLNALCKRVEIVNCPSSEWININTEQDYRRALQCLEFL
jgi:choline kinase